ncbi:MAG: twin-arginine translocase TatA/TatE family subunit [Tenuifilum sp.]|jgi:Sec-independent protein translocase protein TatA|uniref:Sec-independent protein translocase subunit TatA/TatB n=1 Tax=Tenuifilum sp. TaxID=2760880 RepID=UPI001B42984E|nr:twin-arginine translocase TatA/TatE family subunit [Bacteroidales bacterium]HOK61906.1 twin-arginine translocase TatA/TatE family subunit [Tenuifilum sp.]MBP9029816.1 twin-arginine translocase TatA/TatE family subunit [Bacteroidales bacterium]HON71291.1 twin-arginine translocase TatA/TatE family subunit [Tenuifilum sp.]HOU74547.1 twin-arginine translocase TatA/TatE family subunit [Tenuifilum sp.]
MILLFVGLWELVVIVIVALLLFDSATLLNVARLLGRAYHYLQKSIAEIRSQISLINLDDKDPENDDNPSSKHAG